MREVNNQMNVSLDSSWTVWEKYRKNVGHENRKNCNVVIIEQ